MRAPKLTDAEIAAALSALPGWNVKAGKLHKEYRFAGFSQAMRFMATAAAGIEKMDHHPEWSNVYNRVRVDLSTHDSGGITRKDVELARMLDEVAGGIE